MPALNVSMAHCTEKDGANYVCHTIGILEERDHGFLSAYATGRG